MGELPDELAFLMGPRSEAISKKPPGRLVSKEAIE